MKTTEIMQQISSGALDSHLQTLYVDESLLSKQQQRYIAALEKYNELFGEDDVNMFTAAGRTEVSGNHTDHQHGRVVAASVNLDAIAVASRQQDVIKVVSDDFDIAPININELDKKDDEVGTSEALIRGVVARLKALGYQIGGFKAFITSDVLIGCGLSSSAAFEDIIGTIVNGLYNDRAIDAVTIAKIGQYAENVYFGKPCGLMDQCACGVGGLIAIDFKDPEAPVVKAIDVDFSQFNHSLCIVDTKGSHADLTDEYAAIPRDMKAVAHYFNQEFLRDVDEEAFYAQFKDVREACGDKPVLRAFHFFNENNRVPQLVEALEHDDFTGFKALIKASGDSSYKYLQNVYANSDADHQAVSIALALTEKLLGDHGVCRVHGGGFAGTIQAFVEDECVASYKEGIERVFGADSCHVLKIRSKGACQII